MKATRLAIPGMDCPAEERLVRAALEGRPEIRRVEADLVAREVRVVHEGEASQLAAWLAPLGMSAVVVESAPAPDHAAAPPPKALDEARTLKLVLSINAAMFLAEAIGALLADSSALLADSLDMFADAAVYGVALLGVHRARAAQLRAARISGLLQLALALGALAEVLRRVLFGSAPEAPLMVLVALAALAANAVCLWLLAGHRGRGAHMKASWIFTTNDVLANLAVIVAAGLVRAFRSPVPDLVAGGLIALLVLNGALRILRLSAGQKPAGVR